MRYNTVTKFVINNDNNSAGVNGGHINVRNADSPATADRDIVFQGRDFTSSTAEELAIYYLVEKVYALEQQVSHVQGLEKTISAMKEVEASLRSDLKRLNADRRDLRESFVRVKRTNDGLEAEKLQLKDEITRLRGMDEEELNALKAENDSLVSTSIDLGFEIRNLKEQVAKKESTSIASLQSDIRHLQDVNRAVKSENKDLKNLVSRLQGVDKSEFDNVVAENKCLSSDNDELKLLNSNQSNIIGHLRAEAEDVEKYKKENEKLWVDNNHYIARIDLLVRTNMDIKAENSQLRTRVDELVEQVNEVYAKSQMSTAEIKSKSVGEARVVNIHCSGLSGEDLVAIINDQLGRGVLLIEKASANAEEVMGYGEPNEAMHEDITLGDVQDELGRQRGMWSEEKDDHNDPVAWRSYIHNYSLKAYNEMHSENFDFAYRRYIQVAALAISAAKSLRRRDLLEEW